MPDKPFDPDWCIAPAAPLRELLRDGHLTVRQLAAAATLMCPVSDSQAAEMIEAVLNREPLTERHAALLEAGTCIPARFWLSFEHNYRSGLAAGLTDTTPKDVTDE